MTELSIALDRYDRHIPFFMGLVKTPPSFDLRALKVGMVPPRRDGVDRHRPKNCSIPPFAILRCRPITKQANKDARRKEIPGTP